MTDDRKPEFWNMSRVIAFQLSLLGEEPKPCMNWRRPFYTHRFFCGGDFPLSDDAIRQNKLLRPDSMREEPPR